MCDDGSVTADQAACPTGTGTFLFTDIRFDGHHPVGCALTNAEIWFADPGNSDVVGANRAAR